MDDNPSSQNPDNPFLKPRTSHKQKQIPTRPPTSRFSIILASVLFCIIVVGCLSVVHTFGELAAEDNYSPAEQELASYVEIHSPQLTSGRALNARKIARCKLIGSGEVNAVVPIYRVIWDSFTEEYRFMLDETHQSSDEFTVYKLQNLDDWYYVNMLGYGKMQFVYVPSSDRVTCTAI